MKTIPAILLLTLTALLLSSCGAIPTLPPLDSTVTIWTPLGPGFMTATSQETIVASTKIPVQVITQAIATVNQPAPTKTPFPNTATVPPATATVKVSATPAFTATPTATYKPTSTSTPKPTYTPTAVPYSLQLLNPYYLKNFTHPDLGCAWMGVAGQIFNSEGQVQKQIVIKAGGQVISGTPVVEKMVMPLAEQDIDLAYGPGGFELTLANSLANTQGTVWIQLFNLGGDPLSKKIYLVTYNDCQKNLILLNFIEG